MCSCIDTGPYVFQIMDDYGGGMSVLWIAVFEMICICWIYGANNVGKDFNFMLDISLKKIPSLISHVILVFLWYIIPLLLGVLIVLSLSTFKRPTFGDGAIHYPEWAHGLGYFLVLIAAAQFPVWAMLSMLYYLCHPKKRVIITITIQVQFQSQNVQCQNQI